MPLFFKKFFIFYFTILSIALTYLFASFLLFTRNPHSPSLVSPPTRGPTAEPTLPLANETVTIGLVGDLGLGRHITSTARSKNDFSWSFIGINSWLDQNDFNLANLESPIISQCPTGQTGTFTFCGDERFLPYLSDNKFIFTLANNHIFNYGQVGFSQTHEFLDSYAIPYFYSHCQSCSTEFVTKTVNGISFGFLGYDFITNPGFDSQIIIDTVKKYDPQVDWLIVSLHWGNEYLPQAEKWRVDLAHQLIDAGADIIHGHHPHVWQGIEDYQNKKIYYSLGNFIFDQSWSWETSHTNIIRLSLSKDSVLNQEITPIEIKFNSQPWPISPTPLPAD